ncbi:MAG: polysaccharide pyruvyl transferase family protein, partial [Gammaproteobacteria bacterium]|nr:polysaccharide pyruvyl transferase family protein [Gammaproteobacteria bacterium]
MRLVPISARFHACIFSLAQNMPTLGLDYYPGQGGKVEQLFYDIGLADDTCRMDSFQVDWLVTALMRSTDTMAESMR